MRTSAVLTLLTLAFAAGAAPLSKPFNPCLDAGTRETVVFLGDLVLPESPAPPDAKPAPSFFGTGFLIQVDGIFYVVTAKHVVEGFLKKGVDPTRFVIAVNLRNGQGYLQSVTDLQRAFGVQWVFAPDADIAAHPFAISKDFNVRVVALDSFLPKEAVGELQDVFFVSYHPGLQGDGKITPILRRGMVSLVTDSTIYLDAFVFPGNSGSPVYTKPSPVTFSQGAAVVGDPIGCRLMGLVGAYLPYQEVAVSVQTGRPRVVFEENTGIAAVVPAPVIEAFTKSPAFLKQHTPLLARVGSGR